MHKIKQQILILKESPNIFARICFKIVLKIYLFGKFCVNQRYRSEKISNFLYPKSIHQISTFTQNHRYPILFKLCENLISNCETTRILSFGCSTGEEVNSLREIFSKPIIYGTDINKYCIQKARKKFNHSKNIFIHSLSITFDKLTDLDVIFCMAVFQHPVNRHDLSLKESKYPFAKFNEEISRLDQKLKKGGLFIIDHADFNFMETSVSKHYKPLEVKENRIIRNRPAFNRENIKVSSQTNFYRIFKKID